MEQNALQWLFQQTPTIVLLGFALYWMAKRYTKSEDEKSKLAQDVIKITVLWETKYNQDSDNDKEIKSLLLEIRDNLKSNAK
jgi:hypothetical protein